MSSFNSWLASVIQFCSLHKSKFTFQLSISGLHVQGFEVSPGQPTYPIGYPNSMLYNTVMKVATMYCSFSLHYSLLQLRILIPRAKASISFQKFRHIMSVFITHKFQLWGMNTWFVLFQQPINIYCINLLD